MKYVKHQYLWNSSWPDIFEVGEGVKFGISNS